MIPKSFLQPKPKIWWAEILKWALLVLIVFFTLDLMARPFKTHWSADYLARGDVYLMQKKYLTAEIQYDKAVLLNKKNTKAKERISLARDSARNVLILDDFFVAEKISSQIDYFNRAKAVPADKSDAVNSSKYLIQQGEYQLAAVSAQTATEMDSSYRDAWLYLGIANLKTVENVELSKVDKQSYRTKAKDALFRAQSLDPLYQPTKDFLTELGG